MKKYKPAHQAMSIICAYSDGRVLMTGQVWFSLRFTSLRHSTAAVLISCNISYYAASLQLRIHSDACR